MRQWLILISCLPFISVSQADIYQYDSAVANLQKREIYDSVYFELACDTFSTTTFSESISFSTYVDSIRGKLTCDSKVNKMDSTHYKVIALGYLIETFSANQKAMACYYNMSKGLTAKVDYKGEIPVLVEFYDNDLQIKETVKFENGVWVERARKKNWEVITTWTKYEIFAGFHQGIW